MITNKLSFVSTEDINYMRTRVKYYNELPDKEAFLTFLDDIESLNDRLSDTLSEADLEQSEEEGFKRAMRAVETFFDRVSIGARRLDKDSLIGYLKERK